MYLHVVITTVPNREVSTRSEEVSTGLFQTQPWGPVCRVAGTGGVSSAADTHLFLGSYYGYHELLLVLSSPSTVLTYGSHISLLPPFCQVRQVKFF